jgi:hypothetical protein
VDIIYEAMEATEPLKSLQQEYSQKVLLRSRTIRAIEKEIANEEQEHEKLDNETAKVVHQE